MSEKKITICDQCDKDITTKKKRLAVDIGIEEIQNDETAWWNDLNFCNLSCLQKWIKTNEILK